jgi:hypothetical protein
MHRGELIRDEAPHNGSLCPDHVESMESAWHDLELCRHSCCVQPVGVVDAFIVKEVCGADADPRRR